MYMYMRDVRTRYGRYFLYAYFFWQCHLLGTLRETAAAFSYKSLSSLHLVQTRLWLYYEIVGLALNDFSLTLRIIAFCRQLFCLIFCCLHSIYYDSKVYKILKGSLDSIPSPSPSVKLQIIGGKVWCKVKTLLGVVNKLLEQCFTSYLK